jgi:hypothetical protein
MNQKIKILLLLVTSCFTLFSSAQEKEIQVQVNLEVGKLIKINPCKKGLKEFEGIDVYARNKAFDKNKVNKETGEGLIEAFFEKNTSIDAKRLPCVMGGHSYKIGSLQEFPTADGIKRVIICYTTFDLTIIWIDLDKSLAAGEISL